jgi:hypothetical protein
MAVHLLNFSIDPPDRQPDFIPEDLTINEIESIAEFLTEIVFGYKNAFAEHDESDDNNGVAADFFKVFYTNQGIEFLISNNFSTIKIAHFIQDDKNFSVLACEIASPPPEA